MDSEFFIKVDGWDAKILFELYTPPLTFNWPLPKELKEQSKIYNTWLSSIAMAS